MFKRISLIAVICLLMVVAGCSSNKGTPEVGRDTLTQVSTVNALMDGSYDGTVPVSKLIQYGDFGLGTVDKLDGEMVELNDVVYQVRSNGNVYKVPGNVTVPFAEVTWFHVALQENLTPGMSMADFQKYMDSIIPTDNIFYAVKIEGTFSYMKTRSVPAQQKPYPILSKVTANQAVFEFHSIQGTVVGFRCPSYVQGINVPGYHLHFLDDGLNAGGHILDFTITNASLYIDEIPDLVMLLPGPGSDFYKLDLSNTNQSDLQKVEQ